MQIEAKDTTACGIFSNPFHDSRSQLKTIELPVKQFSFKQFNIFPQFLGKT